MSKIYFSKTIIFSFYISVLFLSFESFGQFNEIQTGDFERIHTKNMTLGQDSKHNVYHKYIFEIENFEEYTPNIEKLAIKLKKMNQYEDFSISNIDKLITLICIDESSITFIPNLKKILAEDGFRLYKIQEILLEKIEAE
jgi:hypothetical protein